MTDDTIQPDLAEQLAAAKVITDHQFKRIAELEERNTVLEDLLRRGFAPSDEAKDLRLQAQDRLLNKYQPIIEILAKDYQWDSGTGPSLHYIRNMARAALGVRLLTPADYKSPGAAPAKARRSVPIATAAAGAEVAAAVAAVDEASDGTNDWDSSCEGGATQEEHSQE